MIVAVIMLLIALALLAVTSGVESGLYSLERVRLRIAADEGDRRAARLLDVCTDPARALAVLLLLQNIFHATVADLNSNVFFRGTAGIVDQALLSVGLTPVILIIGELLPKALFLRAPHRLMRFFEPGLRVALVVLGPILAPVVAVVRRERGNRVRPSEVFDRAGVRAMLTLGDESHALTESQRVLADRVLRLRAVAVRDCMVPIDRVDLVGPESGVAEILACGAATRHSRFPVRSSEGAPILGYVTVAGAAQGAGLPSFRAADQLHAVPTIDGATTIAVALYRLQKAGKPLGVVVEGRERKTAGIITVADIIDLLFDEGASGRSSRPSGAGTAQREPNAGHPGH